MSPTATTTPTGTQAAILQAVITTPHPKIALPSIASTYHMTLVDLQALLKRHGYPSVPAMSHARQQLLNTAFDDEPATEPVRDTATSEVLADFSTEHAPARRQLVHVEVSKLQSDPDNVRDALTDIEELAESIQEAGLLEPILARRVGQRLVVVAGHRRLAAVRFLRWDRVDCIIDSNMRPEDVVAAMLIENGHRVDLDPIEEARGLNRLKIQHQLSDAEVGKKVGRSQPWVSTRLALLTLSADEQAQYRAGNMSLQQATHLGRMNAGKVKPAGQTKNWHLGPEHDLAERVKARCTRAKHPRGRWIGGMGCGACWDAVIRADERQQLHDQSARQGECVLCGHLAAKRTDSDLEEPSRG